MKYLIIIAIIVIAVAYFYFRFNRFVSPELTSVILIYPEDLQGKVNADVIKDIRGFNTNFEMAGYAGNMKNFSGSSNLLKKLWAIEVRDKVGFRESIRDYYEGLRVLLEGRGDNARHMKGILVNNKKKVLSYL